MNLFAPEHVLVMSYRYNNPVTYSGPSRLVSDINVVMSHYNCGVGEAPFRCSNKEQAWILSPIVDG